jgi:hypothetical protein
VLDVIAQVTSANAPVPGRGPQNLYRDWRRAGGKLRQRCGANPPKEGRLKLEPEDDVARLVGVGFV